MKLVLCTVVVALIYCSDAKTVPVLYAAGGSPTSDVSFITDRVAVFRLDTKQWCDATASLPKPLAGHTAVQYRNKLIIAGGEQDPDQKEPLTDVFEFDPATNKFRNTIPFKKARRQHGAVVANDKIYVAGGLISSGLPHDETVEVFDGKSWTSGPPMNEVRAWHALASVTCEKNGKSFVWALGGRLFGSNTTEYLDVSSDGSSSWTPGPIMRYSRWFPAAAVVENVIYVCGGAFFFPTKCEKLTLDPDDCSVKAGWTTIADTPTVKTYTRLVPYGDKLLFVGVQDSAEQYDRHDIHQYDPASNTWSLFHHQETLIPTLWFGTVTQIDLPDGSIQCDETA